MYKGKKDVIRITTRSFFMYTILRTKKKHTILFLEFLIFFFSIQFYLVKLKSPGLQLDKKKEDQNGFKLVKV